jgi:uridine kinase
MTTSFGGVVTSVRALAPVADVSTVIVAIDGFSGAGKSTLAGRLAAEVPGGVVVHTDDFSAWDNPFNWWPRLIEQVLRPLSTDDTARYQRHDWDDERLAEWHTVQPGGLVIIEGMSSSRQKFRPYLSLAVWVDAPRELRLERGIERDGEGMRAAWLGWMASEDEWAAKEDPRSHAELIISGIR